MTRGRNVHALALVGALGVAGALTGCGADEGPVAMVPSSFTGITEEIDRRDAVDTEWIVAASSRLVTQLADGARADVLITADEETMQRAIDDGLVSRLGTVARNQLVLATAPGNPGAISSAGDLENPDLVLGVCAAEVPCGRLAAEAASTLGLTVAADTEESNVRSLALKIAGGELDAGLIYATDALALGLDTVDDVALAEFDTDYPAAATDGGDTAVVDFLRSPEGRELLTGQGFTLP